MANYLMFERRGCEFFGNDYSESDIGNYRLTTPGEIVPGKDGKMYCFEFGVYDRYDWRKTNKRTGKPLKHPVRELTMSCAMRIDSQFTDDSGSWRNLKMETEFYRTPRKYTEKNILEYVNSVSSVHYDAIMYVDTFMVEQDAGKNFAPANMIYEWAKKNRLESYNTLDGITVKMYSGEYRYLSYSIVPARDPAKEYVYITLERVAA